MYVKRTCIKKNYVKYDSLDAGFLYIRIQVSKGIRPLVLAHKWIKDLGTCTNMTMKVN